MSTKIEREIVQMVFEAKEFRKGIRQSIEDLEGFKKSFDLSKAQESFGELEKASRVDFSAMTRSLESINNKMSVMGVAAAAMVTRITNAVMDGAKKMWNALVMTPITTGLEEYETQLNAVQTILANTSKHGTTLKDVTGALDELNLYADLTIYNFTQMTDSIGKFTTAGVELDTSVKAIKGIANVAALSGSNAQQASTAMYQMSQAISSGMVRLQDWISMENAGIGGTIFQDALMETARLHGVAVDDMVKKNGSFRFSLQEKWLTSDIMLETLEKFTGDMTEAQLLSLGYTEEQVAGILKTAELASDAATKVKTWTQLLDTMGEALQSGWAQSWTLIFGDFEQAKELWGSIATIFGDMIADSAEARNSLLRFWGVMGGREAIIDSFFNIVEALTNIFGVFKEAITGLFKPLMHWDLVKVSRDIRTFSEGFLKASENLDVFKGIIRGFAAAFDIIRLVILAVVKPLIEFIKTLAPAAGSFFETAASIGDTIVAFRAFAIKTDYFGGVVENVIAYITDLIERAKELKDGFFELEVVQDVAKWFECINLDNLVKAWDIFVNTVQIVVEAIGDFLLSLQLLCAAILELESVQKILKYFEDIEYADVKAAFIKFSDAIKSVVKWIKELYILENFQKVLHDVSNKINELTTSIKESVLLEKFIAYFQTFDGRRITQFLEDAKEGFAWLTTLIGGVVEKIKSLGTETDKTEGKVSEFGEKLSESLGKFLDTLTEGAKNIDYSALFDAINTGMLAAFFLSIRKIFTGGLLGGLFGGGIEDLAEGLTDIVEGLGDTLGTFQNNIRADTLQKIAVALAVLAGSIFLLTLIDSTKLLAATGAMTVMVAALFGSAGALNLIKPANALKAAGVIIGLSIALLILSAALLTVSDLDGKQVETSLIAMTGGLVGLVASVSALGLAGGDTKALKTVAVLIGLGIALKVLTSAIRTFGEMDPKILSQGLIAIAASLGILTVSMILLTRVGEKNMMTASIAIMDMAFALILLATAVNKFGKMDPKILYQGLEAMGVVLVGFGVFSRLLKPAGMISASIGIVIMSGALLIMAEAVKSFGTISWEELQRGLAGMAGALLLLVLAANLMTGALAGAAAMLIMSVAVGALSLSLKLLSTLSWDELLVALAALAATFLIIGLAGLLLAPIIPLLFLLGAAMLLIGLGAALLGGGLLLAATGLVALAGSGALIAVAIGLVGAAIIQLLPKLGTAIAEALVNFLQLIADNTPLIVEAMKQIILGMIESIIGLIPDIVEVMLDMLTALLTTIADKLPDLIQAGYDILLAFIKGIADNIGDVVTTALDVMTELLLAIASKLGDTLDAGFAILTAFLDGIADNIADVVTSGLSIMTELLTAIAEEIPDTIQAGFDILKAFLQGIIDNVADIIAMGLEVVTEFINGIADGLPDLILSAFNLIVVFLNGIADAIEDDFEDILAAGKRIGEAIIEGLVKAITKGISEVTSAVAFVAAAALESLKTKFGEMVAGLIGGGAPADPDPAPNDPDPTPKDPDPTPKDPDPPPKDEDPPPRNIERLDVVVAKVEDKFSKLGEIIQNGTIPLVAALAQEIDKVMDITPVIVPVLDLDKVVSGIDTINDSFDNSTILASIAYENQLIDSANGSTSTDTTGGDVNFIQYNYSPKALDRETIYRQTKTLVAELELRAATT